MKKYLIATNCIGVFIIVAMLLVSAVDRNTERRDSERYDITQGTALCSVEYRGEENGYYIIDEKGLFYLDSLAIPIDSVELSKMCYPGAEVKLYREQGVPTIYDDENRVELENGAYAYYVDNVAAIKFDASLFALGVMIPVAIFLCANDIVCLIIVVSIKIHKRKIKNKKVSKEIN